MQLIFEITWNCPAKCKFCVVPKGNVIIDLELYERALKLFKGLDKNMSVVLSGGEPTTIPWLDKYVGLAKNLGYSVTVVTNGFFPDTAIYSGADLIEVSVDYWGTKHDENRGVKGLWNHINHLLQKAKGKVVIRATLLNDNYEDLLKIHETYPDIPMLVMPVRGYVIKPSKKHLEALAKLENVYIANNCPAGISSFVIAPGLNPEKELDVLACIFYRKLLGRLRKFTKDELEKILEEGRKLPRFPCEKQYTSNIR